MKLGRGSTSIGLAVHSGSKLASEVIRACVGTRSEQLATTVRALISMKTAGTRISVQVHKLENNICSLGGNCEFFVHLIQCAFS